MKTASPLQRKSISGTHVSYKHRHLVMSVVPLDTYTSPAKWFTPVCTFCRPSRAGKASFLSISVGKVSYSWAVYRKNPPSFSWVEEGSKQWGTLIPVYSWHRHSKRSQNTQKCMKFINYSSFCCGCLCCCQAAKAHTLRLFMNSNTKIPICMHPWKAHLTRTCPGEGACLSAAVWNSLELNHNGWYMSRVTLQHKHDDTGACANAALLTHLLNGDILLLLIRRWPSQQKRALGDRTRYSAVQRWPLVTTARLSRQHFSIAGGTFDHKNFIGG